VAGEAPKNSTEDMALARAFDPENARRYINLGYSYLQSNHSWAANREFERALAIERHPYALAGRAAARLNLGNKDGAMADAQASNELEPNEAATWVLADLAYERGNRDEARELYLLIYERGSRADHLVERLHELGVADPDAATRK
jgi:tetratricopeptide (TPR) repeat protein